MKRIKLVVDGNDVPFEEVLVRMMETVNGGEQHFVGNLTVVFSSHPEMECYKYEIQGEVSDELEGALLPLPDDE